MELGIIISLASLAVAILVQTTAFVWFLSRMNSRIEGLESWRNHIEANRVMDRMTKVETYVEIIQAQQDAQVLLLNNINTSVLGMLGELKHMEKPAK